MKTASMALCAALLFTLSVVSSAHSADATADAETAHPCLLEPDEALRRIGKAKGVVSPTAIHEKSGEISQTLAAFRCIVQAPDAVEQLSLLLKKGDLHAQLYALIGLKALNPSLFAAKITPYLARQERVVLIGGDVEAKQTVGALSADIRDDRYSVLVSSGVIAPQGGFED